MLLARALLFFAEVFGDHFFAPSLRFPGVFKELHMHWPPQCLQLNRTIPKRLEWEDGLSS